MKQKAVFGRGRTGQIMANTLEKITLLVADDEIMVRRFVQFVANKYVPQLEIIGEASDGEEAVQKVLALRPDIFLTDIRMPKMDGLAAARTVVEKLPQTQVVFLTAYEEFAYAKQALDLKAEEYLVKPIRPQNLVEVLRRCVSKKRKQSLCATMLVTMNSMFAESRGYVKAHFAEELVQGKLNSKERYFRLASLAGYGSIPDLIAVVEIDDFKQDSTRPIVEEIRTILEGQGLIGGKELFVYHQKPGTFVCFLITEAPLEDTAVAAAKRWAADIQARIKTSTGQSVTIGIGSWAKDPTFLAASYRAANVAKSFRFVKGPGQVLALQDVNYQESPTVLHLLPCQAQLAEAVQLGNPELVEETVDKVVAELTAMARTSPPRALQGVVDTAQIAMAAAREGAMDKERVAGCLARYEEQLNTATDIGCMVQTLTSLVICLTKSVERTQADFSSETVHKALTFIQQNYHTDLTLDKVAGAVYLSPYYFSRLFKRITGMNFTHYLTEVRINAAKQLLRQNTLSVKEVARAVGYADPRYFSSVFKKVVGVSPGDY